MATILVSGASGFIGSHLVQSLIRDGHRVARLARKHARRVPDMVDVVPWDPEVAEIDRDALARVRPDAVINLAGEPIAQRWTHQRRNQIRNSRVRGTRALAHALAALPERPEVLVNGSALGYYGAKRGDELLDEDAASGDDFLARTAREWEEATGVAVDAGIRVVVSRTGLVLGAGGGVIGRILPFFKLGLGGRLGDGRQWMSWIGLNDMVRALRFLVETKSLSGPVNMAAPTPVRNDEFTQTLARVVHRPAMFSVPAFALQVLGTMADNTLLASQRLVPKKLAGAGFEFRHPRLDEALRFELMR